MSEFTIQNKGAVSDETAYEMAAGLITAGVIAGMNWIVMRDNLKIK